MKNNPLVLLLGVLAFVVTGCASVRTVSVVENRSLSPRGLGNKGDFLGTVKTEPFHESIVAGKETAYLDGSRLRTKSGEVTSEGTKVAAAVAVHLKKKGFIETRSAQLLVVGDLTLVNHGSRELRTMVGLGVGASRLDSRMVVYNTDASTKEPWLVIWTTSHSGREPGAIFSLVPPPFGPGILIAGAATATVGIIQAQKGISSEANRTGRHLAREILKRAQQK